MLDRFLLALTLAVSPFAATPTAQCGVEELEVVGTGPKDFLGTSVALRNDLAVIGAREGFPTSKSPTGHADVYRYGPTGWAFEQRLPQTTGMQFGAAVDTDGTNIVVGAPLGIVSFPQIEIFSYDGSTWTRDGAYDAGDFNDFGSAVAIDGGWVAAGGPNYLGGIPIVQIRQFRQTPQGPSWVLRATLTGPANSDYGAALAMDADLLVIGAPEADFVEVHRLQGPNWVLEDTLTFAGQGLCRVGAGVSVEGGRIAVGAACEDAVILFELVGGLWTEVDRVLLPTASSMNGKTVVDLDGNVAIAGVTDSPNAGRTFLMRRVLGDWDLERELFSTDPGPFPQGFGTSVSVDDARAVVGHSAYSSDGVKLEGKALFYPATPATLSVDSTAPAVGDVLQFLTCGGAPGDFAFLRQTELDGVPFPATSAAFGFIGAGGSWSVTPEVPRALAGSLATFEATVMTATGPEASNPVRIQVE